MTEPIAFTDQYPQDRQIVTVFCDGWPAPQVMEFRADFHGAPRLLCASDGRHYWYPERMSWRACADVAEQKEQVAI